jgi:FAD/FMN-containing dehydrogenase/ferredoxin
MTQPSFLERVVGQPLDAFTALSHEQRTAALRPAIPDLGFFLDEGRAMDAREAPPRTRELAASLLEALAAEPDSEAAAKTLAARIVTDAVLRGEADRDQNVYLGALFTRTLTRAVPDLIFLPASIAEAARALRWGRERGVPVSLRGAASTAMGGAVPNEGGLTLDLSRLDQVEVDAAAGVCVVGAGARLRTVHQRLAERGFALRVYPSNPGGTLAGWFVTGGIGLNAFGHGRALDSVRAADVLLPDGEHVRFHDDGRLDVPDGRHRRSLPPSEAAAWFIARGLPPMALADLAGSEGVLGVLVHLTVSIEPRPEIGAFLLSFARREGALLAIEWMRRAAGEWFPRPANLKLLSGSHMRHVRRVWADEDAREWKRAADAAAAGAALPWSRITGPGELGASTAPDRADSEAYLFVDFLSLEAAGAFARSMRDVPGSPLVLDEESVRFAAERLKPQQTKRLGPGLIAAEIVMPVDEVKAFLPRAEAIARGAGNALDAEVYLLADGGALVIGGFLTDHRNAAFAIDLLIGPALVDLAMRSHRGRPYVLGRWQAAWFARRFEHEAAEKLLSLKAGMDPASIVNRGVLLGLRLRGALGRIVAAGFQPGVSIARTWYGSPALSWVVRLGRRLLRLFPGPGHGRGEPAGGAGQAPSARAIHCVNCGECNSVCPIFHDSKIRLPQMLTHLGEAMHARRAIPATGSTLLDLCMRCGNCEEVCQAGIPHLPLYDAMQRASDAVRAPDRERHVALLAALRGSPRYLREFLRVRPGGYLKRAPASLPGVAQYLLLRAENDAGPAATCIHCGACVPVCPTGANREFEGGDPRAITTDEARCIGCGACVEVCPANELNGGRTLRVLEAPTRDWFLALDEFERQVKS